MYLNKNANHIRKRKENINNKLVLLKAMQYKPIKSACLCVCVREGNDSTLSGWAHVPDTTFSQALPGA